MKWHTKTLEPLATLNNITADERAGNGVCDGISIEAIEHEVGH